MNKTYLIHHGIKGQKWGDRQAEWYPIDEYKKAQKNAKKAEKWRSAAIRQNQNERKYIDKREDKLVTKFEKKTDKRLDKINDTDNGKKKGRLISKHMQEIDQVNTRLYNNGYRRMLLDKELESINKMTVDELLEDRKSMTRSSMLRGYYAGAGGASSRDRDYIDSLAKKGRVPVYTSVLNDQQLRRRIGELDVDFVY